MIDKMFPDLMARIDRQADHHRAHDGVSAIGVLEESWSAVLVFDEGITLDKNELVCQALLQYIKNGGKAICMGMFPAGLPSRIKQFFGKAGLKWEVEDQHKATVHVNKECLSQRALYILPLSYDTTSFFLRNSKPEHAWFRPTPKLVPFTTQVEAWEVNPFLYSSTMAPFGKGHIGFVGSIREEAWSNIVILGMIGIWSDDFTT